MLPAPPTGHWYDDYERGRPGYPAEAVDAGGGNRPSAVLELGAGTGKFTRLLVDSYPRVIAVEPDAEMRRQLAEHCPAADLRAGSAEAVPLERQSVDAVFAAEAFHWFDGARALAEIERVLRPGGALVLLWNVPGGPSEPPIDRAERILIDAAPPRDRLGHDPVDLNTTRFSSGVWQEPFADSMFGPLEHATYEHLQVLDRESLIAFFESMGWVGHLPEPRRAALLGQVRAELTAATYRRRWTAHRYRTWLPLAPR